MNLDDYQKKALESVAITEKGIAALSHRTLGLVGESGIVANQMKKVIRDRDGIPSDTDVELAREKIGDTLYYVAVLAEYFGLSLEEVAKANLAKSSEFMANRKK
jgi:NTP pyrophosphatase (non-canonical NTP hydrolase)